MIVTQEEALAAFLTRQKASKKDTKVIKFVFTPDEGEVFDKRIKRALKRKSDFASAM